jgi:DNA-binding XRE family transcriptional regulator
MVDYKQLTDYEVLILLDDGNKVLYDDFDKTYRMLPYDIYDLSEESYGIEFGRRLSSLMNRKGITQYDLACLTGLSQSSISGYINGKRIPSAFNCSKIIKTLHCSDDEIRYLDILS